MFLDKDEKVLLLEMGDITGNGVQDEICIKGCLNESCKYNASLVIKEKASGRVHKIGIDDEYYKFEISLESFKCKDKKDILLRCIGESYGGYIRGKIYSYEEGKIVEIFDSNVFYEKNKVIACYNDNYEIEVKNLKRNKKYFINIKENCTYYLDFVYDESGKVKQGKERANISRVSECYSFCKFGEDTACLSITQKILGQSDTDYIGDIESIIKWKDEDFKIIEETVNTRGSFINQSNRDNEIFINEGSFKIINGQEEGNKTIKEIIKKEFNINRDDFNYIKYEIDLNVDEEEEVVVYLRDWYFCTVQGCKMLILKRNKERYDVIGRFENVAYPVMVSDKYTNGYRELIFYISDFRTGNRYRKFKFDRKFYTYNMFLESEITLNELQDENITGYLLEEYYNEQSSKVVIDTKIRRMELVEIVTRFIIKGSEILFTSEIDIDGDGSREIVAGYRYDKTLYLIIIEESIDGEWAIVDIIKGRGCNFNKIILAPLENNKNYLIVVWKLEDISSTFDIYSKDKDRIYKYLELPKSFSNIGVEDIDEDGVFEIIIWNKEKDKAYEIDIYRVKSNKLIKARELYEKYFKELVKYYEDLVNKNPIVPMYWYYLSKAQFIAGFLEEALKSINMNLSFQNPYFSKEEALLFKEKIEDKIKKD